MTVATPTGAQEGRANQKMQWWRMMLPLAVTVVLAIIPAPAGLARSTELEP